MPGCDWVQRLSFMTKVQFRSSVVFPSSQQHCTNGSLRIETQRSSLAHTLKGLVNSSLNAACSRISELFVVQPTTPQLRGVFILGNKTNVLKFSNAELRWMWPVFMSVNVCSQIAGTIMFLRCVRLPDGKQIGSLHLWSPLSLCCRKRDARDVPAWRGGGVFSSASSWQRVCTPVLLRGQVGIIMLRWLNFLHNST